MAFVGISQRLLSDVHNACRRMCNAELATVGEVSRIDVTNNDNWFKELAYGEHQHLMNVIPEKWTRKFRGHGSIVVFEGENRYELTVYGEDVMGLPPGISDYRMFTVAVDNPRLPEFIPQMFHILRERRAVEKRWNDVSSKVGSFLQSCKSLNEAIKLWPEIEHYLPKEYMERVLQKREKSTSVSNAAEVLGQIDTEELTAAVVIARMAGATA